MIKQEKELLILKFLSYLRIPFAIFFGLSFMAIVCVIFTFSALIIKNRKLENWIISNWAKGMCFFFSIKVEVHGLENLPKSGCLLVFNHASHFDIPIMYSVLNKNFRFGAKAELLKVPFLGRAIKSMGALPIHRGKRNEVLKLYEKSIPRIDQGESFSLAAEGTRNDKSEIGRFKTGPFIFAAQARTLISPILINGAFEVLNKNELIVNRGRWSRRVVLQVLPPIDASKYSTEDFKELQDVVREKMVAGYNSIV